MVKQIAVNYSDGGSIPPRGDLGYGRAVIAAVCKTVLFAHRFESYWPQLGCSIIGNTAILGIVNVGSNPAVRILYILKYYLFYLIL